ncbi:MAG: type II toxin-antitoxin system prevent-host-death family antitoxin [Desulfosalsimonadaceae bacterium]
MEINVKEARSKISTLLDLTRKGEEIVILRRGKKAARLVPAEPTPKHLPDLTAFRNSITVKGGPLSNVVRQGRDEERY